LYEKKNQSLWAKQILKRRNHTGRNEQNLRKVGNQMKKMYKVCESENPTDQCSSCAQRKEDNK